MTLKKHMQFIYIAAMFLGMLPLLGGAAGAHLVMANATALQPLPSLDSYGKLPMQFEPNVGQIDPSVRFMAHTPGGTIFFTPSEVVMSLQTRVGNQETEVEASDTLVAEQNVASANAEGEVTQTSQSVVTLRFVGADGTAILTGDAPLSGRVNYLLGNDPSKWHADIHTYAGLTYNGLYPGIRLAYEGKDGALKGTYTVAPNSDPGSIRWRYDGAANPTVDSAGNLLIQSQGSANAGSDSDLTLMEQAPVAWQEMGGERVAVAAGYAVAADGSIGFMLGAYDRSQPLIVDPSLTLYSFTYLGGGSDDYARSIAVDASGNTYITGYTTSSTFPTTLGALATTYLGNTDAFVTKLNANGTALVYSTYLGGGSNDAAYGIAVDAANNAYVTGHTQSSAFPVTDGGGTLRGSADAFVTKLNPAGGALVYSRYLGGTGTGNEWAYGIAVDTSNFAYVTGFTYTSDFPVTTLAYQTGNGGDRDLFVTKLALSGTGAPIYSTYLGGGRIDGGTSIALDGADRVFVTGYTNSADFDTTTGAYDSSYNGGTCDDRPCYDTFVARLNTSDTGPAALVYSTYLGGSSDDFGQGIAALGGYAYMTGMTKSPLFPWKNGLPTSIFPAPDGFPSSYVSKVDTNATGGNSLIYSTYFGHSIKDWSYSIAVDPCGNVFIAGDTAARADAFHPVNFIHDQGTLHQGGVHDGFVAELSYNDSTSTLTLPYNTYLGGSGDDLIYGLALGKTGYVYVVGSTTSARNSISSSTVSSTDPVLKDFQGGLSDGFVARIDPSDRCLTSVEDCPCPMDVAFVLDTTGSMQSSLFRLREGFPSLLTTIQATSGGDYRLSLVTFKDDISVWDMGPGGTAPFQSWSSAPNLAGNIYADMNFPSPPEGLFNGGGITNLQMAPDYGEPEASDEALRTVLEERTSGSRGVPLADSGFPCSPPVRFQHRSSTVLGLLGQCGPVTNGVPAAADFGPWRLGNVRRIVVFFTDARPGEFTDKYNSSTLPLEMANLAGWRNIQVISIAACASCYHQATEPYAVAAGITRNYAYATNGTVLNGRYIPTYQTGKPIFDSNGATIGDQLSKFIKDCDGTQAWNEGDTPVFHGTGIVPGFVGPIRTLAGRGVLGGYPCGGPGEPCIPPENLPYFRADNNVTRGQASKIVANAAGYDEIIPATQQTFTDVPPGSTFYLFIERAALHGVIGGYPCGGPGEPCDTDGRPYFRPVNNVTRGQLSKIVSNAAGFTDTSPGQIYRDVPSGGTFYDFVMRLYLHDATNATACGTDALPCNNEQQPYFGPDVPATRGETALFVANSFYP
jgi:hypothetical protein